jgi:hypothetical protein
LPWLKPPRHCTPVLLADAGILANVLHAHAQACPHRRPLSLTRGIVVQVPSKSYSHFIIMRHILSLLVLHTVAPDGSRHPALAPGRCTSSMDLVGVADVIAPAQTPSSMRSVP